MREPTSTEVPGVSVLPATGPTRAVVLVLHGGQDSSRAPVRARQLSVVRMVPVARGLHRAGARRGLAVWSLRYRVRGWNGDEASPVIDARWALDRIAAEHPGVPIVVVGHSMGGRVAVRVAGAAQVCGVVALAPWLPRNEPIDGFAGRRLLVLHGTRDRWTDVRGSRRLLDQVENEAIQAALVELRGAGHFMLRRRALWSGLTVYGVISFAAGALAAGDLPHVPPRVHRAAAAARIDHGGEAAADQGRDASSRTGTRALI